MNDFDSVSENSFNDHDQDIVNKLTPSKLKDKLSAFAALLGVTDSSKKRKLGSSPEQVNYETLKHSGLAIDSNDMAQFMIATQQQIQSLADEIKTLNINLTDNATKGDIAILKQEVTDIIQIENQTLRTRIDEVETKNNILEVKCHELEVKVNNYETQITNEDQDLATLCKENKIAINDTNQYSRRNNLRFFGVNLSAPLKEENTKNLVLEMINTTLNLRLSREEVTVAHRLPIPNSVKRELPSIIARFHARELRDFIHKNQAVFRRKWNILVNEDLTPENSKLYREAKLHTGFKDVNFKNGRVRCVTIGGENITLNICSNLEEYPREVSTDTSASGYTAAPTVSEDNRKMQKGKQSKYAHETKRSSPINTTEQMDTESTPSPHNTTESATAAGSGSTSYATIAARPPELSQLNPVMDLIDKRNMESAKKD